VLREMTGLPSISAKDFRTWGGTVVVTEHLARSSEPPDDDAVLLAAIDAAAEALGNSRTVCRASYVHPGVVEAARTGRLQEIWSESRARAQLRRGEVALLTVLT
jgi:DNA topoisomerase-1